MLQRLNWHSLEYRRKMIYLSWSLFLYKISNVKIVTTKKDALKQSLRRSQYMHFSSLSLCVRLIKDNNGFKLERYLYSHEYRGQLLHNIPFFNCHVQPLAKYAICWGRPVFGRSRSRGTCIETTKRFDNKVGER